MTVAELIAKLADLPPELPVRLCDAVGDYRVSAQDVRIKAAIDTDRVVAIMPASTAIE